MEKIIVLNHKMNLLYDEVLEYIYKLNKIETKNNIIVCPSNIYLESFINYCDWGVGCQNVCDKESGDYTGEISTLQLKSLGVEYTIIGDREEDNNTINKKAIASLESNIIPIVCVKDKFDEEELINDVKEKLKDINSYEFVILALLGNMEDNLTDVEFKIQTVKNMIKDICGKDITIIYGGNINKENINKILDIKEVDGVILGSISSNFEELKLLLDKAN